MIYLSTSSVVHAIDYTYTFNAGYEDSNNLSQRVGGEGGSATDYGIGFTLGNSLQKEWDLDLIANIDRTNFSGADLNDETNTTIQGSAIYKSLTSNFSFTSVIDVSQAPVNRFQTQSVNNVRDQFVYALVPSYYFAINPTDRINASYTYLDFNLDNTNGMQVGQAQSSQNNSLLVNYAKRINATNTLAINARTGKTDFDDADGLQVVDYDRDDLFLSWTVSGETDQMQLELGRSEIVDQQKRKSNLNTQLLLYTRQLNRTNTFSLGYNKGFNNPLSNIQATGRINVNQQNNNITAAQETKEYNTSFVHTGDSLSFNLGYADAEVSQSFSNNLEKRKTQNAGITYLISRALNVSGRSNIVLNYSKSESDFNSTQTNISSNEIESYSIIYNHVYSSNLVFALSYSVRDSTQLLNDGTQNITDSESVFFTVTYSDRGKF